MSEANDVETNPVERLVMPEFKREIRYVVLKISHMDETQKDILPRLLEINGFNPVAGLVVETDWPEYEVVWNMIEARMKGEGCDKHDLLFENSRLKKRIKTLEA